MRGPKDRSPFSETVRQQASRAAKARQKGGKALGRIQYFEQQRDCSETQFSAGKIRQTGTKRRYLSKANRLLAALQPDFATLSTQPLWRPLGPTLIPNGQTYGAGKGAKPAVSGRCTQIVIDSSNAQVLTLASAGGGIWRSENAGADWRPLTDQQPTLSMGALVKAPSAPQILYAATGEGDTQADALGFGLLRSSDGGATWTLLPANALIGNSVYELAVNPEDPLHLFAASNAGLLESTDGGAHWQRHWRTTTWSVSFDPKQPSMVYAANADGLRVRTEPGSDWQPMVLTDLEDGTEFRRMAIAHAPSQPSVLYVCACDTEGNASLWQRRGRAALTPLPIPSDLRSQENLEQAWYDWCFAVAPDNADEVYWGVVHLYRGRQSAQGHWTWQNISTRSKGDSIHPDQHRVVFDTATPGSIYVCNDGGLFHSPDRGKTWRSLNKGLSITEFEALVHMEHDATWICGGTQDNGTLNFMGNHVWRQIALGDGGDCGVDEANNFCYHSFYGMWIMRAKATGTSRFRWRDVSPEFPDDYPCLFYPPMDVRGRVLAKAGITLFVSVDSGEHWDEVDLPGANTDNLASALTLVSATRLLIGLVEGQIIQVERTGQTYRTQALGVPRIGYVSDVLVHANVIWASISSVGGAHVFRSLNHGEHWEDRSGDLPDIPVNALVIDPKDANRLFAATDHGVYQTLNAGQSWRPFSNGLPKTVVSDLIFHQKERLLRAGTKSRGAWELAI